MKINNLFFIILMVLLAGCQLGQDAEPAVGGAAEIDEVKAALNRELLTPAGKLKSVFQYQGFEHFIGRQDWYYNEQGQVILTIGLRAANDTSGASLYGYDKLGNQVLKKSFDKSENRFISVSTKTSVFNDRGNLLKEYLETINLGNRLIARFYYDERGLLAMTQFGDDGFGDRYVYSYDDQKRVSKMRWLSAIDDYTPIMEYFNRYNEKGQLEAKETWSLVQGGEPREDAFQYFYNEKVQLMEEKEFYPEWGFEPRFRKTYEYYPDGETSGK